MDERPTSGILPYEPLPMDPATRAFTELKGELALLRRAVEHVAAEKADIEIPDYSNTLARIAKSLIAIESAAALQVTPEDFGARFEAVAGQARREDRAMLAEAEGDLAEATRSLRACIGTAATIDRQNRRCWWWAGGGYLAGCLTLALLPGFAAHMAPTSWHWPERIAAHAVREPSLWEAGTRLMRTGNPEGWQAIVDAADMRQANRETLAACEQRAVKARQPVRCAIRIRRPVS